MEECLKYSCPPNCTPLIWWTRRSEQCCLAVPPRCSRMTLQSMQSTLLHSWKDNGMICTRQGLIALTIRIPDFPSNSCHIVSLRWWEDYTRAGQMEALNSKVKVPTRRAKKLTLCSCCCFTCTENALIIPRLAWKSCQLQSRITMRSLNSWG